MATDHTGTCRCGVISVEAREEPFLRSYCHCRDCRKQTGAPVMAFVGFRDADLDWFGEPQTYRFGGVERSFCSRCGSQIGYRDDQLPGAIYLSLGFMDQPERYPPTHHAFAKRRLAFLHMNDDLPRFEDFSIGRNRS